MCVNLWIDSICYAIGSTLIDFHRYENKNESKK